MKLPAANTLVVPQEKVADYLLSLTHRDGQHKARFFLAYGYSQDDWEVLAATLQYHGANNDVVKIEESKFGKKYVVEGEIETPNGRTAMLRSVWFIEADSEAPRFVTAYPLEKKS